MFLAAVEQSESLNENRLMLTLDAGKPTNSTGWVRWLVPIK